MATTRQRPGAVRAELPEDDRKRGGWWKWLLALLLAAAVIAFLAALLSGDDDGQGPAGTGDGSGALTVGGESLLPASPGVLEGKVEQEVTGEQLRVVEVNEGEGFWIGTSAQDRVYVEYGGDVGEDEAEDFQVAVGDRVNLTGPVRPAPQDPASALNLQDEADARLITEQGGFINADRVTTAGE